jgi:hypothetical protein
LHPGDPGGKRRHAGEEAGAGTTLYVPYDPLTLSRSTDSVFVTKPLIPYDAFGGANDPTGKSTSAETATPGTSVVSVVSARIPPMPRLVRPSDVGALLSFGWIKSMGSRTSMSVKDAMP